MPKLFAIVGMGDGIGLAVSRRFAREGFAIAMIARNEAKLQGFKDTLEAEGYKAHSFIADAGSESSLKSAFTSIQEQLGNPEVLIYNAAVPKMENVLNETVESLTNDFKINVAGALIATQAVLPAMKAQNQGTIVFTGGAFSLYPSPDFASLSIGKAGIRSLAKMLAEALKSDGIRVGTITVSGTVSPNDPKYNPESIAENYWSFHTNTESDSEIVYWLWHNASAYNIEDEEHSWWLNLKGLRSRAVLWKLVTHDNRILDIAVDAKRFVARHRIVFMEDGRLADKPNAVALVE